MLSLKAAGKNPPIFIASGGCWRSQAFIGLSLHCPHFWLLPSVGVCVCLQITLCVRTPVIGIRAQPDPVRCHLNKDPIYKKCHALIFQGNANSFALSNMVHVLWFFLKKITFHLLVLLLKQGWYFCSNVISRSWNEAYYHYLESNTSAIPLDFPSGFFNPASQTWRFSSKLLCETWVRVFTAAVGCVARRRQCFCSTVPV